MGGILLGGQLTDWEKMLDTSIPVQQPVDERSRVSLELLLDSVEPGAVFLANGHGDVRESDREADRQQHERQNDRQAHVYFHGIF
jgi:hypothetical protein